MNQKTFRLICILVIPLLVISFITADQLYRASARLKSAPGLLLESFPLRNSDYRPTLVSSLFFRDETEGIQAVIRALEAGETADPAETSSLSPGAFEYVNTALPLPLMMHLAISRSEADICLNLASLWDGPPSGLYRSAAMLENGMLQASRDIWESLPEKEKESWLGRRILRQLGPVEAGGTMPPLQVYSRAGIPMGSLRDGSLSLNPGLRIDQLLPSLEESLKQLRIPGLRGVRTSIDLELQQAALESLDGFRGSIVLLDSSTGEILAAASDARTLRSNPAAPFSQQYEPASISKLVTSSAALRAGIDVDEFMEGTVCKGGKKYSGEILWCSFRSGRLGSLARALADSCNIAFADLGVAAGRTAILDELQIFGFDRQPAEPFHFGRILQRTGNDRQLADLSIGLESTTITPVHGALLAAVFANGGIMPEPSLLSSADGMLGLSPRKFPARPGSWVINDPESLEIINSAMREVVSNGTARGLPADGFPVAMKTGTGRTAGTGYVTNYVGFGPLPEPRIAFCVRVTHQPTSSRVRKATREVLSRLLEKLSD